MTFVQAKWYRKVDPAHPRTINVIVLHDMEFPEKITAAEQTAAYFADPNLTRQVSAHACVDSNSTVFCVHDEDIAFTCVGANGDGLNVEQAGYAAQTDLGWNDDFSQAMILTQTAPLVAEWCKKWRIPPIFLTADAMFDTSIHGGVRRGITTHWEHNKYSKKLDPNGSGFTHTDPGLAYPIAQLVNEVKRLIAPPVPVPPVTPLPPMIVFDPANGKYGLWPLGNKPTVKNGSVGDAVKYLQGVMKNKASQACAVDGKFGPQTEGCVKNIQAVYKITVDGVCGPQTWSCIDQLAVK